MWKEYDFNQIIVIGDTHGHLNTLLALIAKLPKGIPIFLLGDMIDKGKRSKEIIEYAKENLYAILGNHDHLMTVEDKPFWKRYESLWLENNGAWTHRSYGGKWKIKNSQDNAKKFREHINWLRSLPIVGHFPNIKINDRELYISHAGLDSAITQAGDIDNLKKILTENTRDDLLKYHSKDTETTEQKIATDILWHKFKEDSIVDCGIFNAFGHTTQEEVVIGDYYACVDTKVYGPNKLSALILPDMKIISQDTLEDTWGEKK